MQKLALVGRWSFIFVVMAFFSFQSLAVFGIVSVDKALAEDIRKDDRFENEDRFMVDDEVEGDSMHTERRVCTLSQTQLDMLRTKYSVTVKQINKDSTQTSIAIVKGTKKTKKADIYKAIGVDKKDCKIMKRNMFFTLFLLPGVS
jgi:hypothetical protein